jgi:RNA polymerase sigma-70 factor, ECF subfamily
MTLATTVRGSWQQFLEAFEGLRPELYRYCRHLTRSPWDAEDLAQDGPVTTPPRTSARAKPG